MDRALTILRITAAWLLLIPAGLLIWEMTTPQMTFGLLPLAYGLMFGSLLTIYFAALLAVRLRRTSRAR